MLKQWALLWSDKVSASGSGIALHFKPNLLIWDQMGAGGLSSYFKQAPRKCGPVLLFFFESWPSIYTVVYTPGLKPGFSSLAWMDTLLCISFFFLSHFRSNKPCGRICLCISSHSQTHQLCGSQHFNIYLNMSVPVLTIPSFFCVWEGYERVVHIGSMRMSAEHGSSTIQQATGYVCSWLCMRPFVYSGPKATFGDTFQTHLQTNLYPIGKQLILMSVVKVKVGLDDCHYITLFVCSRNTGFIVSNVMWSLVKEVREH